MKSYDRAIRQERIKEKAPKSVQNAIPIRQIWPEGVFLVGNKYTKVWRFEDINYTIASVDDQYCQGYK